MGQEDVARHAMFVLDTSKAGTGRWNPGANAYRQGTYDAEKQRFALPEDSYIGEPMGIVERQITTRRVKRCSMSVAIISTDINTSD